jgi:primosomal protein N' (replication factor Y)
MSVIPEHGDPRPPGRPGDRRARADDRSPGGNGSGGAHQDVWFGLADEGELLARNVYAGVVFNRPIEQVLTYRVPARLAKGLRAGQRVRAPLGRGDKLAVGYCVQVEDRAPEGLDPMRIKALVEVLDPTALIDRKMLELTRWLADYYACSWGQALDAAVPAGVKKHAGTRVGTFLVVPEETREAMQARTIEPRLSAKQAAVLEILARSDEPLTTADVCRLAKCSPVPIQALQKMGLIHSVRRRLPLGLGHPPAADGRPEATVPRPTGAAPDRSPCILTADQAATLARIEPALEAGGFAPYLIHGVTGSGKTEVYLSAIERVVARGREAIVLVPEISLTPQTIRRFRRRFARVAVLHSHLSDAERHRHWQGIASGEIEVVVGVRSAIFAPARKLGLIVIDEEHEGTFK